MILFVRVCNTFCLDTFCPSYFQVNTFCPDTFCPTIDVIASFLFGVCTVQTDFFALASFLWFIEFCEFKYILYLNRYCRVY